MSEHGLPLRPLLARYPDARLGKAPLIDPVIFPYLGLVLGFAASIAAVYNAIVLRRLSLAVWSILFGLIGCLLFLATLMIGPAFGAIPAVLVIVGRVVHFAIGGALFFLHRPHYHGHEFHSGPVIPMLPSYVFTYLLSLIVPWRITIVLLGGIFV